MYCGRDAHPNIGIGSPAPGSKNRRVIARPRFSLLLMVTTVLMTIGQGIPQTMGQAPPSPNSLRRDYGPAVVLLHFRRKVEPAAACDGLKQGKSSWGSGFILNRDGFIITTKHTFGAYDNTKDKGTACAWAFVRDKNTVNKYSLDLDTLKYGQGDYAQLRFENYIPTASISPDPAQFQKSIDQADELYFMGYDAPSVETETLEGIDSVIAKSRTCGPGGSLRTNQAVRDDTTYNVWQQWRAHHYEIGNGGWNGDCARYQNRYQGALPSCRCTCRFPLRS